MSKPPERNRGSAASESDVLAFEFAGAVFVRPSENCSMGGWARIRERQGISGVVRHMSTESLQQHRDVEVEMMGHGWSGGDYG